MYQGELTLADGALVVRAGCYEVLVNDHGVVVDGAETLSCPHPRKGWLGVPPAEIQLCQVPGGWSWAVSCHFPLGGMGEPLFPNDRGHELEPTREAAIAAALDRLELELRGYLRMRGFGPSRETRAARAWMQSLRAAP